jgi:hypothetical protein
MRRPKTVSGVFAVEASVTSMAVPGGEPDALDRVEVIGGKSGPAAPFA